jgi:hypothetical protein
MFLCALPPGTDDIEGIGSPTLILYSCLCYLVPALEKIEIGDLGGWVKDVMNFFDGKPFPLSSVRTCISVVGWR